MSRKLCRPYTGSGYACEDCRAHVNRRKRYDRRNLCESCAVAASERNQVLFATQGKALYRALVQANGAPNGAA